MRPLVLWPDFDWVAGKRFVAVFAGVIFAATLHLDGDDVGGAVIMVAARLRIEIDAAHIKWLRKHSAPGEIAYSIWPRRASRLERVPDHRSVTLAASSKPRFKCKIMMGFGAKSRAATGNPLAG